MLQLQQQQQWPQVEWGAVAHRSVGQESRIWRSALQKKGDKEGPRATPVRVCGVKREKRREIGESLLSHRRLLLHYRGCYTTLFQLGGVKPNYLPNKLVDKRAGF